MRGRHGRGGWWGQGHTTGGRRMVQPSCCSVLLPFFALHERQAVTQLLQERSPPLLTGSTWSMVSSARLPQYLHACAAVWYLPRSPQPNPNAGFPQMLQRGRLNGDGTRHPAM